MSKQVAERILIDEVASSIQQCEENPGCYSWKLTAEEIVKRCKEVLVEEFKRDFWAYAQQGD